MTATANIHMHPSEDIEAHISGDYRWIRIASSNVFGQPAELIRLRDAIDACLALTVEPAVAA